MLSPWIIRTLTFPPLLASSVPCIALSHLESWCKLRRCIQIPWYDTLYHTSSSLYLPQNSQHTYLSWHFHSHSEIYCHATSIIIMTYITFVILPLHDHVVDIVFVANPPCIIFHTCHSWFIAPSRYTAGGIHIESYLVLVLSCNPHVEINRSVMIIIVRALRKRPKK